MSSEIGPKRHNTDAIELGLTYLAANRGRARRAAKAMVEDGHPSIPPSTLHAWKTSHAERYAELRERALAVQDDKATDRMYAIRHKALKATEEAVDRFADNIDRIEPKDLARSMQALALSTGILQDKAQVLQGKPSHLTEKRVSLTEIEAAIQAVHAMQAGQVVDATVVDDVEEIARRAETQQQ